MNNQKRKLTMTIALDALRHLGMNLYSSLPPVLSELVANAYDARAKRVDITINEKSVEIKDDGIGMTRDDVIDKYLYVGRDRRADDMGVVPSTNDSFASWPKRDKPMGRKGIGKLSMFSIADTVEVYTIQDDESSALRMVRADIEESAKKKVVYEADDLTPLPEHTIGTHIILKDLKRKRKISPDWVRRAIARRFSVISYEEDGDFNVFINDRRVVAADWDIFKKFQCLWHFGEGSEKYRDMCSGDCKFIEITDSIVELSSGETRPLIGWFGTVLIPSQLRSGPKDNEINDNKIVIDSRGKVSVANFLYQFGESGNYASYLAGYIRADYLDEGEDIATSDRERMKVDDPRVIALRTFTHGLLKKIQGDWTKLRKEGAVKEAKRDKRFGPIIIEWLDTLNEDEKDDARNLLGHFSVIRLGDNLNKAQFYKYGILAFERLRVRNQLNLLRNAKVGDSIETIAKLFGLESDLENALYADIANQRLEVLKELVDLHDSEVKEKVIQRHIFDHLWLLEPSWTIQNQINARIEQNVKTEFTRIGNKLSKDEAKGRIDIRYRQAAGFHIIVELKRPGLIKQKVYDLLGQTKKYVEGLEKCLVESGADTNPMIKCVCLLGKRPDISNAEQSALAGASTLIITYNEVITAAYNRFAEYVEAQKKFKGIQGIVSKLDAVK